MILSVSPEHRLFDGEAVDRYTPRTEGNEFRNLNLSVQTRPDIPDGMEKEEQGGNKNGNPDKEHRHEFNLAMSIKDAPRQPASRKP